MKKYKRKWIYSYETDLNNLKSGVFIQTGIFEDGHFAYSRIDENENIIAEDEGEFIQMKLNNKLIMVRI